MTSSSVVGNMSVTLVMFVVVASSIFPPMQCTGSFGSLRSIHCMYVFSHLYGPALFDYHSFSAPLLPRYLLWTDFFQFVTLFISAMIRVVFDRIELT